MQHITSRKAVIQTTVETSCPDVTRSRRGLPGRLARPFAKLPAFLAAVVLGAFVLRILLVVGLLAHAPSSTINYNDFGWESWEMGWVARSLVLGHGFSSPFLPMTGPTALVPPLYPYLLAGMFHFGGMHTIKVTFMVLGFNSLCSALTCIPLYFIALNSLNRRSARLAAIGWAVYPFAVYFSAARVWDYALTGLLFSCCLLAAQRLHRKGKWAWAGFGALYGLAAMSNPSIVSLLPFLLGLAMWRVYRMRGPWLRNAALTGLAFIAVCTPWQLRNQLVMHSSFFVRDGIWLEAYAGNNGDTHESNSAWAHPASNPVEMQKYIQMGEIRYMAEKKALVVDFAKHHPGFVAVASLRRVVRFWTGYWSFDPTYLKYEPFDLPNVPFCLFLLFFMVKGLIRWWKEDRPHALPYLIAVLVFPIPYYLTHSSMDYRQPLEPLVIILVTIGLFGIREKVEEPASDTEFISDAIYA